MWRPVIYFDKEGGAGGGGADPPVTDPPADPPVTDPPDKGNEPKDVPYKRFSEINTENSTLKAELEKRDQAEVDRKKKQDEDDGKWKDLYEQEQSKNSELTLKTLRTDVAIEIGLPLDLAGRLVGGTKEELVADAQKLLEVVGIEEADPKKPPRKGVPKANSRKSGNTTFDLDDMSPEEIRTNRLKISKELSKK